MMRVGSVKKPLAASVLLLAGSVLFSASAAFRPQQAATGPAVGNEILLAVDPAHSTLHYSVDSTLHTVHGAFALKAGTLRIDPATGKASGSIVADATSGESGNGSRDKRMHKEILESDRFTEIVFKPDHVEGKIQPQGSSTVQVHGIFVLHGSEHQLTVPVNAELAADHWKGSAKFVIPYIEWGLKNPSNFMLKVNKAVNIDLELSGNLQAANAQ